MSNLQVENKSGILVVDSRLIADSLDIEHRTLLSNIKNHESVMVEAFGAITFEMLSRSDGNTGGKQAQMCWLTEEQATFAMTLSRNTPAVVAAKVDLVRAFSEARHTLQTTGGLEAILNLLANVTDKLDKQEFRLLDLAERTQRLDEVENKLTLVKEASQRHRGCGNVIQSEVENEGIEDNLFTAKEYLILKKVSLDHFRTLSKRAANFTRVGKGEAPTAKRSGHLLFEETYLREALKSILELD